MKCRYHSDRESTHVVDALAPPLVPVCDECADAERDIGALKVTKHSGYLFGFPVIVKEDALDAEFIDA